MLLLLLLLLFSYNIHRSTPPYTATVYQTNIRPFQILLRYHFNGAAGEKYRKTLSYFSVAGSQGAPVLQISALRRSSRAGGFGTPSAS